VGFAGKDLVTLEFPLPGDLREGMYSIRLGSSPRVRDGASRALDLEENRLPAYIPAASSADVVALRKRYLGKFVYGIGRGLSGVCSTPPFRAYGFPPNVKGKLVGVTRVTGKAPSLQTSSRVEFLSIEPLEYEIETPRSAPSGATAAVPGNASSPLGLLDAPVKNCPRLRAEAAGTWQFERTLVLYDPIDPSWPRSFRLAAAKGTALVGMTHAMVAAAWGYPEDFGTVAELQRLRRWDYDMFHSVTFLNDRVTSVYAGHLP